MNLYLSNEVSKAQKKMSGYLTLLVFRYSNLCVKADPSSLLSVDVEGKNIEDVADVMRLDDECQIAILPKNDGDTTDIIQSVLQVHPEFKVDIKMMDPNEQIKDLDEEALDADDSVMRKVLIYTMPEVDSDRRKLLLDVTDSLYEECKNKLELINEEAKVKIAEAAPDIPTDQKKDIDRAAKKLKETYETHSTMISDSRQLKKDEIEEGYQRYLEKHPDRSSNSDFDVTQGLKMKDESET